MIHFPNTDKCLLGGLHGSLVLHGSSMLDVGQNGNTFRTDCRTRVCAAVTRLIRDALETAVQHAPNAGLWWPRHKIATTQARGEEGLGDVSTCGWGGGPASLGTVRRYTVIDLLQAIFP